MYFAPLSTGAKHMSNLRHGHTKLSDRTTDNPKWRAHHAWCRMRQRCNNPMSPDYANYGWRGIAICKRWEDFENFYADMGDPPPGLTLERINNNRGYSPKNCRWATRSEQSINRRNRHLIKFEGRTMLLQEWAKLLGIGHSGLIKRLRKW